VSNIIFLCKVILSDVVTVVCTFSIMIFCSDFCVQYFSVLNYVTLTWYIT